MAKETHHFLILILIVILTMAAFTLYFTYSLFPSEDQAPRRSRAVAGQATAWEESMEAAWRLTVVQGCPCIPWN